MARTNARFTETRTNKNGACYAFKFTLDGKERRFADLMAQANGLYYVQFVRSYEIPAVGKLTLKAAKAHVKNMYATLPDTPTDNTDKPAKKADAPAKKAPAKKAKAEPKASPVQVDAQAVNDALKALTAAANALTALANLAK